MMLLFGEFEYTRNITRISVTEAGGSPKQRSKIICVVMQHKVLNQCSPGAAGSDTFFIFSTSSKMLLHKVCYRTALCQLTDKSTRRVITHTVESHRSYSTNTASLHILWAVWRNMKYWKVWLNYAVGLHWFLRAIVSVGSWHLRASASCFVL